MAERNSSSNIPDSLRHFDSLPDSANVRVPIVAALFNVSEATVWRYAKAGVIPTPHKLGPRLTAWKVGELRRALNAVAA